MKAKLTDAYLRKPPAVVTAGIEALGRAEVVDDGGRGLGVRFGRLEKSFFLKMRSKGKHVRVSLGVYPAISLLEARRKALELAIDIKRGIDPIQERRQRKARAVAADAMIYSKLVTQFLDDYCGPADLSPKTVEGYKHYLQGPATSSWSNRPIGDITDLDVIAVVGEFEREGKLVSARNFRAYARKFFNWCRTQRKIAINPAADIAVIAKPKDYRRDRSLSFQELAIVIAAANRLPQPAKGFILSLILFGQRRGETAAMTWGQLTLDGVQPVWKLPAENTKNDQAHDVPLADEAVTWLKGLKRLKAKDDDFVFESDQKTAFSAFSKTKKALDELIAKIERERGINRPMPKFRVHDVRRTVASRLGDLGIGVHTIEMILNHEVAAKGIIGATYNKSRYDNERRHALALWAKTLAGLGLFGETDHAVEKKISNTDFR